MMLHYLRCCCVVSSPGRNIKTQKKNKKKNLEGETARTSWLCQVGCVLFSYARGVFCKAVYEVVYAVRMPQEANWGAKGSGYIFWKLSGCCAFFSFWRVLFKVWAGRLQLSKAVVGRKVTSSLVSIVRRPCFWLLKGEKKNTSKSLTTAGYYCFVSKMKQA